MMEWRHVLGALCARSRKHTARTTMWRDEKGVTTAGMTVAITLSLVLIFSGGQLYKVSSASSEIQEVADVAALAAQNEVAEFMIAANMSDAAILSLTLLAAMTYGIGIVVACVPPASSLSAKLIELGGKVVEARNTFAEKAAQGLNALQAALPYLSAANAMGVSAANDEGALSAWYYGIGVLVPQEGLDLVAEEDAQLKELAEKTEGSAEAIREAAAWAEEAAVRAQEAKAAGYAADCGNAPSYCMYERAASLSSLADGDNPYFGSVDAWSFKAALDRAKRYYHARVIGEVEPSGSVADAASYHLRKRYYQYCLERLIVEGSIEDGPDGFLGFLPKMVANTAEMRMTPLYTECRYPATASSSGGSLVLHAYEGCPAATAVVTYGSLKQMESGMYQSCSRCGFQVESLGNIASASTNIPNGFEHHYEKVRQALMSYADARADMDPATEDVKESVSPLLDVLTALLAEVEDHRILAQPPGNIGCIAIVVNTKVQAADTGFQSAFIESGTTLGVRAAVSAATLVKDSSHEDASIITSLLDGAGEDGGVAVGAARVVLDLWSALLHGYENGQAALDDALRQGLDGVPTTTASGLGDWCADALSQVVQAAGLQPADTKAHKPALLNSGHVASTSSDPFAVSFSQMKIRVLGSWGPKADLFSWIGDSLADAVAEGLASTEITIAEIELPLGGGSIPITLTLPPQLTESTGDLVASCVDAIGSGFEMITGGRRWE